MPTALAPLINTSTLYLSTTHPSSPTLTYLPTSTLASLKDLGPSRVRNLRASSTNLAIISHIPLSSAVSPNICRRLNDGLYAAIIGSPERRIRGLAMLSGEDGGARSAEEEFRRCVAGGMGRGFVGGVVVVGKGMMGQLGDGEWDGVWRVAERWDRVVFLRGELGDGEAMSEYESMIPQPFIGPLLTTLYATHNVSPLQILSLYFAGVFDRFPKLKILISANAHFMSLLLPRIEATVAGLPPIVQKPRRDFDSVWQYNIWISTADTLDVPSMRLLLEHVPISRIVFGTNYPLDEGGRGVMDELRQEGVVDEDGWERIAWRNAEVLFGTNMRDAKRM